LRSEASRVSRRRSWTLLRSLPGPVKACCHEVSTATNSAANFSATKSSAPGVIYRTNLSTNGAYADPVRRKHGSGRDAANGKDIPRKGETENAAAAPADLKKLRREKYTLASKIEN
jgi:hypothetical protein